MKYLVWVVFVSILMGCTSPEEEPIDHTEIERSEETVEEAFSDEEQQEEEEETATETEQLTPIGYELDFEFINDEDWSYEWNGSSYVVEGRDVDTDRLEEEVMGLLDALDFSLSMGLNVINTRIYDYLSLDSDDVKEFEFDLDFENGTSVTYEYEPPEEEGLHQIFELELELEFFNGDELDYEYDVLDNEAEVKQRDGSELDYESSLEAIDVLLYDLDVDVNTSINGIKQAVLSTLSIEKEEVEKFEFKLTRESGERIEVKHDHR